MKPGQQKSSEMETQSFQGISRYNRALSVKQTAWQRMHFPDLKNICHEKCLYHIQFDVETPSKNYPD